MLVSVRGRIHYSKWTDRDGVERYGYEIIADDVQFLEPSQAAERGRPSAARATTKICPSEALLRAPAVRAAGAFFWLFGGEAVGGWALV